MSSYGKGGCKTAYYVYIVETVERKQEGLGYRSPGRAAIQTVYYIGSRTFNVAAARTWNGLPEDVTSSPSLPAFRK